MNDDPASDTPAILASDPRRGVGARATWRVGHIFICAFLVVLALFLILGVAEGIVAALGYKTDSSQSDLGQAIASGVWEGSLVLVVLFLVRRTGGGPRNLGLVNPDGTGDTQLWTASRLLPVVSIAYVSSFLLVILYQVLVSAVGLDNLLPSQQVPDRYFFNDPTLVALAFSTVIMAPIGEELLFRGFLFAGLRRYMPFIPAALISGLCFSLAHGQLGLIIPFAGVGMIFAYVYERTKTIFASMSVHFIFNLVSMTILILAQKT